MRMKTILALGCFVALLLTGAVLSAQPAPALPLPALDNVVNPAAAAPVCSAAPAAQEARGTLGPVTAAACPASVYQACYQRYGTCTLCFCFGSSCSCENRCV
jgi:hypothetical protein